jgi:hypothetical protein
MKKLIIGLIVSVMFSCTKQPVETYPGNVNVTLDYAFPSRSGDITAKDGSPYLNFYNKYISSKVLTPKTYVINFNALTLQTATTAAGEWGSKILVALPPDKYAVNGVSRPVRYGVCGDTCYLKFHDTIDITQTTTNITLKAYYDCSLILLDTTDVKKALLFADTTKWTFYQTFHNAVKTTMMKTADFYHTFYADGPANGDGCDKTNLYLNVTSRRTQTIIDPLRGPFTENISTDIILWLYKWEPGKYYYFSATDNGYTLSPMIGN